MLKRINRLIDDVLRDPTAGIGKPEPLRHMSAGAWSRWIIDEHRLVYLVDDQDLIILQDALTTPDGPTKRQPHIWVSSNGG